VFTGSIKAISLSSKDSLSFRPYMLMRAEFFLLLLFAAAATVPYSHTCRACSANKTELEVQMRAAMYEVEAE
jgi:hypothetical protein